MHKSIFLFIVLITFSFLLTGQQDAPITYQRSYTAQLENHQALDVDSLPGGGIVSLAIEENSDSEFRRINVTSFDNKGNINWSNTYEYMRDYDLLPIGDISFTGDDSIAFSVILDTVAFNRAITKIGLDGGHGWTRLYSADGFQDESFSGRSELFNIFEEGIFHITNFSSSNDDADLLVSLVDYQGEVLVTKSVGSEDSGGNRFMDNVIDAQTTIDSGVVVLSNTNSNFVVTKMNRVGDVVWMKSYESPLDIHVNSRAHNFTELSSGDLAILAFSTQSNGSIDQSIVQVSESGDLEVTYSLSSTVDDFILDEITSLADTSFVVGGFSQISNDQGQPFTLSIAPDTTIRWANYYQGHLEISPLAASVRDINGMTTTGNDEIIWMVTGGNTTSDNIESLYFTKIDNNGGVASVCVAPEVSLNLTLGDYVSSDLVVNETVLDGIHDTISVKVEEYTGFSPPILSLSDTVYCPQDPINFTIDATVDGGVGYMWSSNAPGFGPVITVMEEGEYSVTVTVINDGCFSLCDTSSVTLREFPMVEIIPIFAQFCETGEAILSASANNPIEEIQWSTGVVNETRIGVTGPGTYSVSIVDDCGNPAQGSITLNQADFDIELPLTASPDNSLLCENGTIQIGVDNFQGNPNDLAWSNDEVGVVNIAVSEPGTYSVTFNGFCPGNASVTLTADDFLEEASIDINQDCGNEAVRLISTGEGIIRVEWSTGESIPAILVTEIGTYTLTGFDVCGDPLMVEIEVDQDDLDFCGVNPPLTGDPCLEFPNAFVPESREEINRIFAPKNECGQLDNYELRIYNRWGAEVFQTERVDDGWNGSKGDKEAPNDVYFFYASYGNGGVMFEEKGDLLLIR